LFDNNPGFITVSIFVYLAAAVKHPPGAPGVPSGVVAAKARIIRGAEAPLFATRIMSTAVYP
jgi:hypothetical protein